MPLSRNLGTLTTWNLLSHSSPVTALRYLSLLISCTVPPALTLRNSVFFPQCICVAFLALRTNSDFCTSHKLIGFYKRGRECLLRGTNWVFNSDRFSFVIKRLILTKCSVYPPPDTFRDTGAVANGLKGIKMCL